MTCRDTMAWLLEAELDELEAPGNPEIAAHIASCQGCHARVARVAGDTAWLTRVIPRSSSPPLAPAVESRTISRRSWRLTVYGLGGCAAALLIVFLTRSPRQDQIPSTPPERVAVAPIRHLGERDSVSNTPAHAPVRLSERRPSPAPASALPKPGVELPGARAIRAVAVAPEVLPSSSEHAIRLDTAITGSTSARPEPRASFAIDALPSTGRYAVLRSTPKVTVVWFY